MAAQLGVANYGQMTAGGWMYIGPQGIVHGTYSTILNAGRLKLGIGEDGDLRGLLLVSSGLGGMSGAQPKAAEIAGAVSIIAEVDSSRIQTRHEQGWVQRVSTDVREVVTLAAHALKAREPLSIAYHGNIVDLLDSLVKGNLRVDLLSDQTSCHAAYSGGYCPQGITFEERTSLLKSDRKRFRQLVDASLRRHFALIKALRRPGYLLLRLRQCVHEGGLRCRCQGDCKNGVDERDGFIFPSYVEDIMGPYLFDFGYGPFRWVCLSGKHDDLVKTDRTAMACIEPDRRGRTGITTSGFGTRKRTGWSWVPRRGFSTRTFRGRVKIALAFNDMVRKRRGGGPS